MKNLSVYAIALSVLFFAASCSPKPKSESPETAQDAVTSSVTIKPFGRMKDGRSVNLFTLTNHHGVSLSAMNYGGIITSIIVPDTKGVAEDVVLGYDSLSDYEKESPYFGALIGRYGNRIAKGKFSLDGKLYTLATNDGANHLHGGKVGFDKVYWSIEPISQSDNPSLKLTYTSKDGEEGYPGTLSVEVLYTLTENDELKIEYKATTDKKTVLNLTQHTYFNLTGNSKKDILGHELTLAASRFLPVDKGLIPTGELKPVASTPFDFTSPAVIGKRINQDDPQLKAGIGYDHCWILSDSSAGLKAVGKVYEPASGRQVEVFTTEPAIQFYSGNFLNGTLTGKSGVVYKHRFGLCLETQHYPDSPNHPAFPSVVLEPGKTFSSTTVYKFSAH